MQTQLRILILEDSPSDAEFIERELKKGGIDYTAKITDTEESFTEALATFLPDVILSDHALPGFNSIEALAICRKHHFAGPFILVTGAVSEEFAVECLKSGADDYILKSKLTRLPSAVTGALKKAEAERERSQAIKNLEEQNVFMSLLLKSIPIAQYVCKPVTHEVTYMSNNIFAFSGYHPDQFMQDPKFWHDQIHPEDRPRVMQELSSLSLHNERSMEYRWLVSDQTYRWIYDRAKIIHGEDKQLFIAGAMIDITLRKEAEEKLALKNKELNTFIYRSTHDLRGPLMTILGLTNVAQDEEEMQELRNYIQMIDECTHKLDDVLLSLITSISIKETEAVSKEINFAEMVNLILDDCKELETFEAIKIHTEIRLKNNLVMDEFAVHSILKNVIENAVKYSKGAKDNPYVSIFIYDTIPNVPNGDMKEMKIVVKDNGIGISARNKDKVFDMFFRGTQVCKGSGLGLYIVKNAAEKMNGTVAIASTDGVGTTVEITLPIKKN